jgi:tRNA-2-methylthio-N6-dimethylallyladenosine synthase
MNKYDSDIVKKLLTERDFEYVSDPLNANFVLINTCSVREHAEKRVLGRLNSLKGLKNNNPGVIIGVIGCMVKNMPELINHPVVDFIAPPDSYRNLVDWIKERKSGLIPECNSEQYSDIFISPDKISSYLSITRGCNYFCSYCIVPYTRGVLRSRPIDEILSEAENLTLNGVGEITLLGQNINAYNYKGVDFPNILKKVAEIEGIKRLNFLTSHPKDIPSNLFSVMADYENITNYLHLPLQSASNKILSKMKREYTIKYYMNLVDKARSILPDLTLSTDILIGFPGEKDEDFNETIKAVKKIRFDQAYTFAYSKRKGTLSALFASEIDEETKSNRLKHLIEVQNKITKERARSLLERKMEVFVVGKSKYNRKFGKNRSGRIIILNGVAKIGSSYIVKIESINGWVPIGKIIKEV